MKLIAILILSLSIISSQCTEFNWIDHVLNDLPKNHQIFFIHEDDNSFASTHINELFKIITENCTIFNTNIRASKNNTELIIAELKKFSSILFIHIFIPRAKSILPSERTIQSMREFSYGKNSPKYLVINYANDKNNDLTETMKSAWNKQMLDFTIIEVISKKINHFKQNNLTVLIHHYNPFLNKFTVNNYTKKIKLFPNNLTNMHGYHLKVGVVNISLLSTINQKPKGKMNLIIGGNYEFIKVLSKSMNFTPDYIIETSEITHDLIEKQLITSMKNGEFDIFAHLLRVIHDEEMTSVRSEIINIDRFCAIVPIIYGQQSLPITIGTMSGYLLALIIVTLFWCLERFTHLDSHYWNPFVVLRLLLGVSIVKRPEHSGDRIMFASLIIVAMMYSSNLYSSMIHGMINKVESEGFNDFREFDESKLIPIISPIYYNKVFNNTDPILLKLKTKVKFMNDMHECLHVLTKYKNISCFMSENNYIRMKQSFEEGSMKLVQPCLRRDPVAFLISQKSPYWERMRKFINTVDEIGLIKKWYRGRYANFSGKTKVIDENSIKVNPKDLIEICKIILLAGNLLAVITFIVELIYHFKGKCK